MAAHIRAAPLGPASYLVIVRQLLAGLDAALGVDADVLGALHGEDLRRRVRSDAGAMTQVYAGV